MKYVKLIIIVIFAQAAQTMPVLAQVAPQALSLTVDENSTCASPGLVMGMFGDDFVSEEVLVTDESDKELFSSTVNHDPADYNGIQKRQLSLAQAAGKTTGLMAIKYWLAPQNLTFGRAEFFVVLDCSSNAVVYQCFGEFGDCDDRMNDYLPRAELSSYVGGKAILDTLYTKKSYDSARIEIENTGQLGLQILSAVLEGPDAASFRITDSADSRDVIEAGNSESIIVRLENPQRNGYYSALIRITTTDPFKPEITVSLTGKVEFRPDLNVDIRMPMLQIKGDTAVITGSIFVTNDGSKTSAPADLTVGLYDRDSFDQEVWTATLLKMKVPAIKPGKRAVIKLPAKKLSVGKHHVSIGDRLYAALKANRKDAYNGDHYDYGYFSSGD